MFGRHKQHREKKRLKIAKGALEREKMQFEQGNQNREKEEADFQNQQIAQKTAQAKNERISARQEGRKYAEDVLGRDVQGLSSKKRSALQYEANKNIQRNFQGAQRRLLGEQSRHGILGKGGVGYAQQRDLERMRIEGEGQVDRDLDKLDSDLGLKKLAAMFNIEQGEAGQSQLDRQLAIDEITLAKEQKKQKMVQDQINNLFNRL